MIPLLQPSALSLDPDRMFSSFVGIFGGIGQYVLIGFEILIIIGVLLGGLYFFFIRKQWYPIPVRIYEIEEGQIIHSSNDRGGDIVDRAGGHTFKLMPMPNIRNWKWNRPLPIQPMQSDYSRSIKGGRYLNILRVSKDIYKPFKLRWDKKYDAYAVLAEGMNLGNIERQLTSNYNKFKKESFFDKYGMVMIQGATLAVIVIFLLLIAKEFVEVARILNSGQGALADAINNLNKQIIS